METRCRVEMGPGHLASSGNLLCPLRSTAGFEHEVTDANPQTLDIFSVGRPLAETMGDDQGYRLCVSSGGIGMYLLWAGHQAGFLFFSLIWPSSCIH